MEDTRTTELNPTACDKAAGNSCSRDDDAIVCFCYRLTAGKLREAHKQLGCLKKVEEATRAGQGCTGCQVVLNAMFGEAPTNTHVKGLNPSLGSSCFKPGAKVMKGFIISTDELESTVYSSNAVAPALSDCDATTNIDYAVLDHRGFLIHSATATVATNATFSFDTTSITLPQPFFGMFVMSLERANVGASRFNICWRDKNGGVSSTHENASTGRPKVWLPLIFSKQTIDGPTTFYAAISNPHSIPKDFTITAKDVDSSREISWRSRLDPYSTTWIDANSHLCRPVLSRWGDVRVSIQIRSDDLDMHSALTTYLFSHNTNVGIWSCNHL
jgi:hypothetical protein